MLIPLGGHPLRDSFNRENIPAVRWGCPRTTIWCICSPRASVVYRCAFKYMESRQLQCLSVRTTARFRDLIKPLGQAAVGALTIGILRTPAISIRSGRPACSAAPLSWRVVRRSEAGPRCRRADRHSGNGAGGHVGDRELDPRISRSVAVATPSLAVAPAQAPWPGPSPAAYRPARRCGGQSH